jgi:RHS repeat-associated protein
MGIHEGPCGKPDVVKQEYTRDVSCRRLASLAASLLVRTARVVLMLTLLPPAWAQTTSTQQESSGTIIPAPPVFHGLVPTWTGANWSSVGVPDPQATGASVSQGPHQAQQDPTDPTHAHDSVTGQNLYWDPDKNTWVNSATGQSVGFDGVLTSNGTIIPAPPVFHGLVPTWTGANWSSVGVPDPQATGASVSQGPHQAQQDPTDPTHAFDATTGQNLNWDPDKNTWVDSKTGVSVGFDGVLTTPPPSPPKMPGATSMVTPGAGFGGATFVNGNAPSTAGFDGAVLFPLGNRVLVEPTASYEWVNSAIVKTVGAGLTLSGSTNANDLNFTGEYTVKGNRVSILYEFNKPLGVLVDAFSGTTSVVGTGTCGNSPLASIVTCGGEGVTNDSNGNPTTFMFTLLVTNGQPASLTFNSASVNFSGTLERVLPETPYQPNAAYTTDPISTANGAVTVGPITDLSLGGPLPLTFRRLYSSFLGGGFGYEPLGFSWMTNFNMYLAVSGNLALVAQEGGGSTSFQLTNGAYQTISPPRLAYQLITTTTSYRFLNPANNLIYSFDSLGRLIRIEDRNGNALTVTQGLLGPTQVADGLGRTLTFNYSTLGMQTILASVQDQSGRSVSFSHDSNFNLSGVKDANGNTTAYQYNSFLLTKVIRPLNNVPETQTYDSVYGIAIDQTDSLGDNTSLAYTSGSTPGKTLVTNPLGRTTTFNYADLLDLSSMIDANGKTSSYTYDAVQRLLSFTDRLGNTTSATYDAASGYVASLTDAQGNTTSFTWQSQAQEGFTFFNLAKIAYPDGTSETFTYDASGNVLTAIDRAGKKTTYTDNSAGQILTATNPAGGVTTLTYNSDGTVATMKDPAGNVTTYSYDSLKRLAKIQFADGTTRSFTRDALDHILSVTDERGKTTTLAYDANNNLQSVTDALGKPATNSYDTEDRRSSATDRLGNKTSYQYDALGSLGAVTDAAGEKTTYTYDNLERLQSTIDPAGKATTFGYDAEGRLTSVTDAIGNTGNIEVDKDGRPVQFTSPLDENTNLSYDSMSRVVDVTDALGRQSAFTYEPRGLPSSITSPGSITTSLSWGNLPVLASITDPNGNVWMRATDSQGRLTSSTDPLGNSLNYTYDSRSRISSVTSPIDSVQFSYDADGNLTQAQYSDGVTHTYSYDGDNRLISGTGFNFTLDSDGRLTGSNGLAMTRDAVGRIASITYAPGKTVAYTYDPRGLLAGVTDWTGASVSFTFDAAHRLVSIVRSNGVVTNYTYDNDSRIVTITDAAGSAMLGSIALTRDAIGRVTSAASNLPQEAIISGAASSSNNFDAADQIVGANYDARGRLTNDNAGATYKWNAASRLVSYVRPDGSASATYDALGQRTSRTGSDGTTRNYVVDYATGLPSVATIQSGGSDLQYYVYTPAGALLFSIEAASGAYHFYSFDDTGSTTFLTNDTGAITDTYGISPYGDIVTAGPNNSTDNPFTWQGQFGLMQEPGTKLYYARFRYYDASTDRFLSRDPLFSPTPREVNLYQYAAGNPVANGDPTGLKTVDLQTRGLFDLNYGDVMNGPALSFGRHQAK